MNVVYIVVNDTYDREIIGEREIIGVHGDLESSLKQMDDYIRDFCAEDYYHFFWIEKWDTNTQIREVVAQRQK